MQQVTSTLQQKPPQRRRRESGVRASLTFAVGLEVSVHGRRLAVAEQRPAGGRLGTGAEAHVGGGRDLLPQGRELHGAGRHGHVVGFVDGLLQAARVVVRRRVGAHGHVVLVYVLGGLAAHRHFGFLNGGGRNKMLISVTLADVRQAVTSN